MIIDYRVLSFIIKIIGLIVYQYDAPEYFVNVSIGIEKKSAWGPKLTW